MIRSMLRHFLCRCLDNFKKSPESQNQIYICDVGICITFLHIAIMMYHLFVSYCILLPPFGILNTYIDRTVLFLYPIRVLSES